MTRIVILAVRIVAVGERKKMKGKRKEFKMFISKCGYFQNK